MVLGIIDIENGLVYSMWELICCTPSEGLYCIELKYIRYMFQIFESPLLQGPEFLETSQTKSWGCFLHCRSIVMVFKMDDIPI